MNMASLLVTTADGHGGKPDNRLQKFEGGTGNDNLWCVAKPLFMRKIGGGHGFEPWVPNRSAPVFERVSHDGLTASRPGDASGEQYYNANYDKCKVALEHGAHRRPIALQQYCQQQVTPGPRDDTAGTPGRCPIECNALR